MADFVHNRLLQDESASSHRNQPDVRRRDARVCLKTSFDATALFFLLNSQILLNPTSADLTQYFVDFPACPIPIQLFKVRKATMDANVVLITGGGSGIGRDCVLAYAYEGIRGIVVADLDYDGALGAATQSKEMALNKEYEAIAVKVDVSDEDSVQAMVDATVAKFGRIDCLINSAGVSARTQLTANTS